MLMLSVVPKEEEGQSQILDPSGRNELLDVAADTGVAADSADGMHRVKWRFCPAQPRPHSEFSHRDRLRLQKIVRKTSSGSYRLAEINGAVSKLRYATFRLVPYHARSRAFIPVTCVLDLNNLAIVVDKDYHSEDNDDVHRLGTVDI
ncbi:hypothetical protein BGW80DRAFT_1564394 [Lactifluus volemus]|nr:hypothetical protein BGW80DRAFT_1564394 [Lactifluus volemus]